MGEIKSSFKIAEKITHGILHARENYTCNHCKRVYEISLKILSHYAQLYKSENDQSIYDSLVVDLGMASHIHDLGKLVWSDKVLKSDESLTYDEILEEQFKHPEKGASIIYNALRDDLKIPDEELKWLFIILFHHWNYDNIHESYPKRIEDIFFEDLKNKYLDSLYVKKDDNDGLDDNFLRILIGIIRIVDSLDAALYERPHSRKKEWDLFLSELIKLKGINFHPDIVDLFIENSEDFKDFYYQIQIQHP